MLFKKTVRVLIKELKNEAVLNLEQIVISCYVPLVAYSNYFERVSTVMNQTHFQVATFAFNTVSLSTLVLNSRDRYEKKWQPNFTRLKIRLRISNI